MKFPVPYVSRFRTSGSAFVLVAVLLLIALVTVLVAVTSILARIERKAVQNATATNVARQNALFGLNVALAQLQKEAGPDQRITARSDILDSNPATPAIDGVNQPYWTGVWKTGAAPLDVATGGGPQRQTSFGAASPSVTDKSSSAKWLISNPTPATALDPVVGLTAGIKSATVAKNLPDPSSSAAVGAKVEIKAPLVPIQKGTSPTTIGNYAYWVSDEGIKAKVTLKDPTLAASDAGTNLLHFSAPQSVYSRGGLLGPANTTDLRSSGELGKVTTLQSLGLVSGMTGLTGSAATAFSPDATTYSYGVLANVRDGGLKKDLTAALESPSNFTTLSSNYGLGNDMVYRTASTVPANVQTIPTYNQNLASVGTDGLPWASLYFHYNAYKGLMPSPGIVTAAPSPAGPGSPANLPYLVSPRGYWMTYNGAKQPLSGIYPTLIAYRVDIAMSSYQSSGTWKLRMHFYPQVVLYNPYGVRIKATQFQYQRNLNAFPTNQLNIKVGSTAIPAFLLNQAGGADLAGRPNLVTNATDALTMDPGETRVFAISGADVPTPSMTKAITFSNLASDPNTSGDFSQFCDVPGYAGTTNGDEMVSAVSLTNRNNNPNAVDTFLIPNGGGGSPASASIYWPVVPGFVRNDNGAPRPASAVNTTWTGRAISTMDGQPYRIIGFYLRVKGLNASSGTNTYSYGSTTVPLQMGNCGQFNLFDDSYSAQWQEEYVSPLGTVYTNGQTDVQTAPSGTHLQTSFGDQSVGVAVPGNRYILRDVPSQPLVSLGQFMHMPAYQYNANPLGSMFIGGSYANPVVPLNSTLTVDTTTAPGFGKTFTDDSFMGNQALFDQFYFSTVPPSSLNAASTSYPAFWTAFNSANSGSSLTDNTKPLLNARMKPYYKNGVAPLLADLRDVDKAAANLLLNGAFNVNSTSVPAWKALLGSLSGNALQVWNASSGVAATFSAGTLQNPIPRFWSSSFSGSVNQAWEGMRALSDAQVADLATQIVQQVKTRGPFLTMADFLNRRLGAASALTRCGALQAAIDNTSPDINATPKSAGSASNASGATPSVIASNLQDANGAALNTATGMPGYLMQQDLVQAFSPVMVARSDTFRVRCYGEQVNKATGVVEGKAWGEAVVQRMPDLVDSSQLAETALASMNTTNQTFGRRFRVVSFRWLNEVEL